MSGNTEKLIGLAEEVAEKVLRSTKRLLPPVARLCLTSTFLEDGVMLCLRWEEQRSYMQSVWSCGALISGAVFLILLIGQLVCSALVLCRKWVCWACTGLLASLMLQLIVYQLMFEMFFLVRTLAVGGGLLLLMAEVHTQSRSMFAGVPSVAEGGPRQYMQLGGRVLLVFMFLTLLHFTVTSAFSVVQDAVGTALMVLVAVGLKTRLAALTLVLWLCVVNLLENPFWMVDELDFLQDFMRFNFFQTLSVIGGLLLLITLGPGGVSLDQHKKRW
ncbi:surfeit locus protein 4-like [Acipenser ruthenus]|uniref:surfeit locus protein 4-like n=1 Tax=Acipenser ruthenus TaxID=7906 RepID=UPI00155F954B|nr:surfeit locus protein 4-like [Acipenser ruthenus]XP_058862857.1 surfeit locus protein 4-like [Acipenser ruthenus]